VAERLRRIVAFAGPSLHGVASPDDRRLDWRPPAGAGDALALMDNPPAAMVLIDGLFGSTRAIQHKEILLLMRRGVAVFGAASMGALRAAELAPFGMIGVGTVFAGYRTGLLTGDDEVALDHAPAALRWRPLSVPMVDIRAALCAGLQQRAWSRTTARAIRDRLRAVHFADRTMASVAAIGGERLTALLADPAKLPKARDALVAIRLAIDHAGVSTGVPDFDVPISCFLRDLAAERGIELNCYCSSAAT